MIKENIWFFLHLYNALKAANKRMDIINKKRPNNLHITIFFLLSIFHLAPPQYISASGAQVKPAIGYGYTVRSLTNNPNEKSLTCELQLIKNSPDFGPDIQNLKLLASFDTKDRLRIKITDADNRRWEVPQQNPHLNQPSSENQSISAGNSYTLSDPTSDLIFTLHKTTPFGFSVSRRSSGDTLFDTTPNPSKPNTTVLVFKDQFLQISSSLPAGRSFLYG